MQSIKSGITVTTFGIVIALLSGCGGKKVNMLPPIYKPRVENGTTIARIPDGGSLVEAVVWLDCGHVECKINDLSRIYHIQVRGKEILLQDNEKRSDLAILLDCNRRFMCRIDKTDTLIITRRK